MFYGTTVFKYENCTCMSVHYRFQPSLLTYSAGIDHIIHPLSLSLVVASFQLHHVFAYNKIIGNSIIWFYQH